MSESVFQLESQFAPAGDQPAAITKLVDGLESGLACQTLLGVTGSGKTFTIANVIAKLGRPTIIMAPNKTLAAQLYGEMKEFFPIMRLSILSLTMITTSLKPMCPHQILLLKRMPLLMLTLNRCVCRPQKPY